MSAKAEPVTREQWMITNARYMDAEMARLRLLLARRAHWLRQNWRRNSSSGYAGWAITDQEADLLLAGQSREEERSFYRADAEAAEITRRLHDANAELAQTRATMSEAGSAPAIDYLAVRFGLNDFERDVLLLAMAPELEPGMERLFAYLQDDATRKFLTADLACSLLEDGESAGSVRQSFQANSPLRRWRLVSLETGGGGLNGGALRVEPSVAQYILGTPSIDDRCQGVLSREPHHAISNAHYRVASQLAQWLTSSTNARCSILINLVGQPDSGRFAVASTLADIAGWNLLTVDAESLPAHAGERRDLIALLERDAVLLGLIYYVDLESLKAEEAQALVRDIERSAAPLIIASRERVRCDREMVSVHVARPDAMAQIQIWQEVLGDSGPELKGPVESLAEQFDFGPRGIARAAPLAHNLASLRGNAGKLSGEDLWEACRQQLSAHMDELAQKISPCYDWDDIVVPGEVLTQLKEITAQVAHRHVVYQEWGFGRKLSRGRGISALFAGPSGVGKTMAAEVMAHHLKLDLYRIDLAQVVSKYIGQTEKNLRAVFDAAERSGAILFFDEADALFGKRSEVKDSHDRYANIEINYLLQRMEDYRGLAILATNMKSFLDSAFMRRLRFIVDFPFPAFSQRMEIWRKAFPSAAAVGELDLHALSRLEIAGGNIRNIAVNSAFLAASEGVPIGMEQVMRAARREYKKIDRMVMESEFGRYSEMRMQ